MKYLVITGSGTFVRDCRGHTFCEEYPDAWLFDSANDAYQIARKLRATDSRARAISEKAYVKDVALEAEPDPMDSAPRAWGAQTQT